MPVIGHIVNRARLALGGSADRMLCLVLLIESATPAANNTIVSPRI
jgi:hypothetical protein